MKNKSQNQDIAEFAECRLFHIAFLELHQKNIIYNLMTLAE
jgi:hypothetical protein